MMRVEILYKNWKKRLPRVIVTTAWKCVKFPSRSCAVIFNEWAREQRGKLSDGYIFEASFKSGGDTEWW